MKDLFSRQAGDYAQYRPGYPEELFPFLASLVPSRERAWDCGTGNGQFAAGLAPFFRQVRATDISASQLSHAPSLDNISYSCQPAEQTDFPGAHFDLVTVAQAIHWFDFGRFYAEVRRVARPSAVLAVAGYNRVRVTDSVDRVVDRFYTETVGPYWDKERRYIDEGYQTIPFPFAELSAPVFSNTYQWTLHHLAGYLNTWSAVQHFTGAQGFNPVQSLLPALEEAWGPEAERTVTFPLLLRIGIIA
ncbi:MAG TPA: class I SAM-dependent methyltransferase [Chitinophagaceae bacterium]|jgi:SAM-dependent methyltransferase|nr:class I SAM-dependent methyltransferase [Chitinophagaceae bacterium]